MNQLLWHCSEFLDSLYAFKKKRLTNYWIKHWVPQIKAINFLRPMSRQSSQNPKETLISQTYHPRLSARPRQRLSVRTMRSINFFHNIPSDMTRYHSLHTSSAEHRDFASKYERMLSAMWSNPLAEKATQVVWIKRNERNWQMLRSLL